jgi:hypothetical protein
MKKLNLNLEEIKDYYYNKNLSAAKIAKIYNTTYASINAFLKKNGCKMKTLSELHRTFEETLFEKIDTEEKAYWLGFLFADGHIRTNINNHKNGNTYTSYRISLCSIDKEVIVKFKKFLKSTSSLKMYTTDNNFGKSDYYVETITSEKMYNDLLDKGLYPNKTEKLNLPLNIPTELTHHFIRGYFDGDGAVFISKTKNKHLNPYKKQEYYQKLTVSIISTYEFSKFIRDFIFPNSDKNLRREKRTVQDNLYYFTCDSKKAEKFYEIVYKNATVYLTRKKDKFDLYLERRSTTLISGPTS